MSEKTEETPKTKKARSGLSGSLRGELESRKWRAAIMGTIALLAEQFGWLDSAWQMIALVAAYILGVAYEDGKAKSSSTEQTNLNVGGAGVTNPVLRTKRTSLTPIVTAEGSIDRVETFETEVKGS